MPWSASGAPSYPVLTAYNVAGLQTEARLGSSTGPGIVNAYDNLGRLKSSTNTMGGTSRMLSYQYDNGGRRSRLTFPDTVYFTYAYDAGGRLTSIKENGGADIKTFAYDALGRLTGGSSTGLATSYAYDLAGRPSSLAHDLQGTASDQIFTFGYNPAQQIKTRTSSNDAFAWTDAYNISRSYGVNGLN